jgi:transposase
LMLAALLAGERDPVKLAELSKRRLRLNRDALVEAFEGCRFTDQHAILIGGILRHLDFLDAEIAALGDAIADHPARRVRDRHDPVPERQALR